MSDDKLDKAVFTIFRLTHADELKWAHKAAPPSLPIASDVRVPLYFEAHLNGRKLALFQTRSNVSSRESADADAFYPSRTYHLALLGDDDEVVCEFPTSSMIRDLLDTVHYKDAKLDQFVDDLLKLERASEK